MTSDEIKQLETFCEISGSIQAMRPVVDALKAALADVRRYQWIAKNISSMTAFPARSGAGTEVNSWFFRSPDDLEGQTISEAIDAEMDGGA